MRGKSQRQTRSTFQQIKAMFWRSPGDESTTKSGKEPRPATSTVTQRKTLSEQEPTKVKSKLR